jgi:hypothetical protein
LTTDEEEVPWTPPDSDEPDEDENFCIELEDEVPARMTLLEEDSDSSSALLLDIEDEEGQSSGVRVIDGSPSHVLLTNVQPDAGAHSDCG